MCSLAPGNKTPLKCQCIHKLLKLIISVVAVVSLRFFLWGEAAVTQAISVGGMSGSLWD